MSATPNNSRLSVFIRRMVIYRKTTIICTLLLCILFIVNLANFQFSASPRSYLGEDSVLMQKLLAVESEYVDDNNILLMFKTSENTIFTQASLSVIKQFTDAAWQLPDVRRVDSISNFQYSYAIGDELTVEDFISSPDLLTQQELTTLQKIALSEPRLTGYLLAQDAKAAGVLMSFNIDIDDLGAMKSLESAVDDLVAKTLVDQPHLSSYKTGFVAVAMGWLAALQIDVQYLFSSAIVIIFIGLCLFFRSFSIGSAVMLLAALSVASAAGTVPLFGKDIQAPSAVGLLMILMLALADSIHVVKTARRLVGQGKQQQDAIVESILFNFKPIIITSVTTAIGFISFLSSEYDGTKVMGAFVAFGVLFACFLSLTLLPALVSYCQLKPAVITQSRDEHNRVANYVLRYRWVSILLTVPMIIISLFIIHQTPVDENAIHYIQKDQPLRKNLVAIEESLTGSIDMILNLKSNSENGINDIAYLQQLSEFAQWLRQQEDVRYVSVYTDTIKQLNKNMFADNPDAYRLPDDPALAAQYLLLYELSLPYGLDLTTQVNMDKSATRMVVIINDIMAVKLLPLIERVESWVADNAPAITASAITGSTLTTTLLGLDTLFSMVYGAILALLIIGVFLLLTFRSFMPGLLCVVMVISPIIVTYGVWSLAVGYFDMAAAIALCMIIGIVVDNAVHFISKFLSAYKDNERSRIESIHYTFNAVGSALLTNAVVLASGFGVLYFSAFKSNATMGVLTVISLAAALIGCFTLLPSLLSFGKEYHSSRPMVDNSH